ncbi:MAG TPA: N-acyl homoserine lactonase family protein [Mesorhizobium sp.]|jgi:N-acyl homoserine lactone hydrolase|uniref:N-acyl homoserine lactonase family protein n=1 Tax=Mesorhizobium sp. TaxID=1871066 RepID=UPI002DDD9CBF|nr:N-acyl homoserine lactonase family protein [Mesorhizobium sp.]HEV2501817.1 N-acyl homoserine lactonase family protein [Mesorhizobium sp.]
MTSVYRLYVLLCGYEIVPKTLSTRDRGRDFVLASPICAYVMETAKGWVLFDTGVNSENLTDPARVYDRFTRHGWLAPPIVLPQHELLAQLGRIGLTPKDISHVILSHTHCDHTGNIKHFRHAPIWIQRLEHEYAFGPHGNYAVFNDDFDFPDIDWRIVEGDWEFASGLTGILTRGHMPGHQSLVVDLPGGSKILTADVGDLIENFRDEVLPGESCDDKSALASIRRLKEVAATKQGELILLHDPVEVQRIKLAPAFYA